MGTGGVGARTQSKRVTPNQTVHDGLHGSFSAFQKAEPSRVKGTCGIFL